MTFEQRRRAVEALVQSVTVTPVDGHQPTIPIRYTFEPNAERFNKEWGCWFRARRYGQGFMAGTTMKPEAKRHVTTAADAVF